ncbi:OmpA family protein [Erythrobacter rubeus]|uniref:OmpA family protein n=1 Tax=Erythrobacter rubeus TaxID=2760803 RepID=A0ABR8KYR8_9SPHN|nr:OmpA family protein [Erythrobacter rubeus]MBD2843356.1 OmpA family protein [Erythrobacter rubeus]
MQNLPTALILAATITLAGCNGDTSDTPDADRAEEDAAGQLATPSPDAPVSIIRADIEQPEAREVQLEPLETTVGFPEGGSDLDAAALLALEELAGSAQIAEDSTIILRAHSDASGSDAANARASEARGEAVRDWLVENGVSADRITLIAFGEQNPVEPNALPDGEPNEAGRAANRRVDIEVSLDEAQSDAGEPPAAED